MTTLDMLHAIEAKKVIYDIHYCRAGVGFIFYDGPPDSPETGAPANWRRYLTVERYYSTLEDAVAAEYARLTAVAMPAWPEYAMDPRD